MSNSHSVVFISLLAFFACAEPTAGPKPHKPMTVPAGSHRTILSSGYVDPTTMSIVDEDDGETYTLNLAANEIRRASDGAILQLTASQSDSAASAFAAIIRNDPSVPQLEEIAPSGQCTGMPGDPCMESVPLSRTPLFRRMGEKKGTERMRPLPRHKTFYREAHPCNRRGMQEYVTLARLDIGQTRSRHARTSYASLASYHGSGTLWLAQNNSACNDFMNAAMPQTLNYRGKRTNWIKNAFNNAASAIVDGVLTKFLPQGSTVAVEFTQERSSSFYASIELGYIRAQLNGYNCVMSEITAGPYYYQDHYYTQSVPADGSSYVCEYENWEISFDDGQTWEPIRVEVCKFEAQE